MLNKYFVHQKTFELSKRNLGQLMFAILNEKMLQFIRKMTLIA